MEDNIAPDQDKKTEATPIPVLQHSQTNGLAIAALVTGIVAVLSGFIPFWGFLVGIAAVVLGVLSLRRAGGKGMAIAGIVTGSVGALTSLIFSALLVIGLTTAGFNGEAIRQVAQEANNSVEKNNADTKAQIDAKKDFLKGETAKFGTFEVKINSVQRDYVPTDSYPRADGGNEFVLVNISVKNTGSESEYISNYDLSMNDNGVSDTASYYDVNPSFDGGDLSPGATTTGNLMYEVTKGSDKLKLQYETTVYESGQSNVKNLTYTLAL